MGDLDGDGAAEAVLVTEFGDVVVCGLDTEASSACAPLGADHAIWRARAVALGDLDGDGMLDVVLVIYGDTSVVCRGDGAFGFTCSPLGSGNVYGSDVAIGDLDGDGDNDVAVAGYRSGRSGAELCLNHGATGLECRALAPADVVVAAVRLADVDGDGTLDVLLSLDYRRGHMLCRGEGAGAFECAPMDLGPDDPPGPATDLAVVRSGNGGPPALLIAGWPTRLCRPAVSSYRGTVRFDCVGDAFDGQGSRSVAVADLDGDGVDDVILGGPNRVCRRDDSGGFTCRALGDLEANARLVALESLVSPTPDATATPPFMTPLPTLPAPTPWPTWSPTSVPAVPTAGAPVTDAVTVMTRGTVSLPSFVRYLRVDGARGVAFGGDCELAPEPSCRAAAVLLDLSDPDQPRWLGMYALARLDETILDAALNGPTLYLVAERRTADELAPARRSLVAVDVTDPAQPLAMAERNLGSPVGPRYPEPEHGGLIRLGARLVWGTSSGLRVYDISQPLSPTLTARLALPATALAAAGARLVIAEPEQTVRVLDVANPARPRDLGNVLVHAGGRSLSGLVGAHIVDDRAVVTLRLECSDPGVPPMPFPGGIWHYPCGSGLAEVTLADLTGGPQLAWSGLLNYEHGLGAVQAVGDLLVVAQGRLVVLDPRRADRPMIGEIELTRVVNGVTLPARPYDIAVVDRRALVLTRIDNTMPAELRVVEIQRRARVFIPHASGGQ